MKIIVCLLLLNVVPYANSCTNAKRPNSNGKHQTNMKFLKNEEKEIIDHHHKTHAVSHHTPEIIKQKRIKNGEELNCNFEDFENCCWNNVPSSSSSSTLWTVASSENISKWINSGKYYLTSQNVPSGHFLTIASTSDSNDIIGGQQTIAEFVSCQIESSDHDIDVTLKYQISSDANLKICLKPFSSTNEPHLHKNCVELPHQKRMTLKELTFPGGENFQIAIVASQIRSNSIIMIDNIEVSALPCMTSTSSTSTMSTTVMTTSPHKWSSMMVSKSIISSSTTTTNSNMMLSKMCNAIQCDFEQGHKCSYTNMHTGNQKLFRTWDVVVRGSFKNQFGGGIKKAGQGSAYLATYLYPRDVAGIMTIITATDSISTDFVIRFMVYKSSLHNKNNKNVELMGCCDNLSDCPFSTEKSVKIIIDKQWKHESFMCNKGTKKIIFYGYNIGDSEGALGLDDIELISAASGQWSSVKNDQFKICK